MTVVPGLVQGRKWHPLLRSEPTQFALLLMSIALISVLVVLGKFTPEIEPDTRSYLNLLPFPQDLSGQRTPLYGWFVSVMSSVTGDYSLVPGCQIGLYVTGVLLLSSSLRRLGMGTKARLAACVPLLLATPPILYSNAIVPEFLALGLLIIGISKAVLAAAASRPTLPVVAMGVATGCAYILRPAFLPSIVLFPVLTLFLSKIYYDRARIALAAVCVLSCAAPFLAVSTVRDLVFDDFNVVSFGGFGLGGVAALMLSPDVVDRLPPDTAPVAKEILARRDEAFATGRALPLPRDSSGGRSYFAAAPGQFDVLAAMFDDVLYGVVSQVRTAGEPWIAFDRRMQRFALATFAAVPDRYAAWVLGATSRFTGRALVTNPAFVVASCTFLALYFARLLRHAKTATPERGRDFDGLVVLVTCFTLSAGLLSVVVTAPFGRYINTASVLLPALPLYGVLLFCRTASEVSEAAFKSRSP